MMNKKIFNHPLDTFVLKGYCTIQHVAGEATQTDEEKNNAQKADEKAEN